jgi:hypothetical protein
MTSLKKFDNFLNEDSKWDPHKAITYIIELRILFEGFEYSTLKFKLLFPHYEELNDVKIKESIEVRLKVFSNIVSMK